MPVAAAEIGIVSADAESLVAFYVAAFGFVRESRFDFPQGVVHRLRCGDARIKIYQPVPPAATRPRPDPWHGETGVAYGALHVQGIGEVLDRAVQAGAGLLVPATNHRGDAWFALVADPEGNVWEVLEEQ